MFILPETSNRDIPQDFHSNLYETTKSSQVGGQCCLCIQPQVDLHKMGAVSCLKANSHIAYYSSTLTPHRSSIFSYPQQKPFCVERKRWETEKTVAIKNRKEVQKRKLLMGIEQKSNPCIFEKEAREGGIGRGKPSVSVDNVVHFRI